MSRLWVYRWSVTFLFYQLLRVIFLWSNRHAFIDVGYFNILSGFIVGIRFDVCVIATTSTPLFLFHELRRIVSSLKIRTWYDNFISFLFLAINIPILIVGLVDTQLYQFTGRRTSPELFAIGKDIGEQSIGIFIQYWPTTIFGIFLCLTFAALTWQKDHSPSHRRELKINFAFNIPRRVPKTFLKIAFYMLIAGILIRGGLQRKPLSPAHAYSWQPVVVSNLILNSGMTLLKSPPAEVVIRQTDFSETQQIRKLLSYTEDTSTSRVPIASNKNIVIIIVESLASEYIGSFNEGTGYTPFIDDLMKRSVVFSESFANGRRSIDAMPAIFSGIPAWRDQPFVTSAYSSNAIDALPLILKNHGYTSYFFHGAANGSMHFDVFSALAGFDHYVGLNEYPYKGDHDGQWGIFDEPFLQFCAATLSKSDKPFLAGIFTLSSHNPFTIPEKYKNKFPKGTLPIHESIGYTDHSLKMFFEKIKNEPWYSNTIFVITGDHTSLSDKPIYGNFLGRFRVPIIFFDPTNTLPKVGFNKIAEHVDITPSLLDIMGIKPPNPTLFGWSLFDPNNKGHFTQWEYGHWYYYDQVSLIHLDDKNEFHNFHATDPWMHKPIEGIPPLEKHMRLKAYRQYYLNGLLDNSWKK